MNAIAAEADEVEKSEKESPPVMEKVSTTEGYHFASKSWKWGIGKNSVLRLSLTMHQTNATK